MKLSSLTTYATNCAVVLRGIYGLAQGQNCHTRVAGANRTASSYWLVSGPTGND